MKLNIKNILLSIIHNYWIKASFYFFRRLYKTIIDNMSITGKIIPILKPVPALENVQWSSLTSQGI